MVVFKALTLNLDLHLHSTGGAHSPEICTLTLKSQGGGGGGAARGKPESPSANGELNGRSEGRGPR